jgi:hypothetical protein
MHPYDLFPRRNGPFKPSENILSSGDPFSGFGFEQSSHVDPDAEKDEKDIVKQY